MKDVCDKEVFENGVFVGFGLFSWTKEQADDYCKLETKKTGRKHDWHYMGGRMRILALPDKSK